MRKKIITVGLALLVAGSSAYGFGMRGAQGGCDNNFNNKHKRGMLLNLNKNSNSMYALMSSISDLDLSKTQRSKIRKVMFDLRESKIADDKVAMITFDENGKFNKEDFIKNREKLSQEMIVLQANAIEKILNILNSDQKEIIIKKLSLLDK